MMLIKLKFLSVVLVVEMIDCYNYIKMYMLGSYIIEKLFDKKYVVFIMMKDVIGLILKGFVYLFENVIYLVGLVLLSNEFVG